MRRRKYSFCWMAALLLAGLITVIACAMPTVFAAEENESWHISMQQGSRKHDYYDCDATGEYLYFSYTEYSCVDVYNLDGVFQYSIILPDRQNGGVRVRCLENRVYISAKNNIIYVFEDREEIQRIDYRTAYEMGYLSLWFSENPSKIRVDQEHISWLDGNGAVIHQIETPDIIAKTIPPTETEVLHKFLIGVLVVLYLPVCALIRYVHNRINAKIEKK